MILKRTSGCICNSLTVDDVEEIDLTDKQRQEVLDAIHKTLKPKDLNYVLRALLPIFGEYECDGIPCECCGDLVSTETWVI